MKKEYYVLLTRPENGQVICGGGWSAAEVGRAIEKLGDTPETDDLARGEVKYYVPCAV